MVALQHRAMRSIGGGFHGTYGSVYKANRERPPGAPSQSQPAGGNTEAQGWNVAPRPGSSAYGSGWGEDNNGWG